MFIQTSTYRSGNSKDFCDQNSRMLSQGWEVQDSGTVWNSKYLNPQWWAIYVKHSGE